MIFQIKQGTVLDFSICYSSTGHTECKHQWKFFPQIHLSRTIRIRPEGSSGCSSWYWSPGRQRIAGQRKRPKFEKFRKNLSHFGFDFYIRRLHAFHDMEWPFPLPPPPTHSHQLIISPEKLWTIIIFNACFVSVSIIS